MYVYDGTGNYLTHSTIVGGYENYVYVDHGADNYVSRFALAVALC